MKKLEFTTSKGEFILEEASDKNLGRVLVKYMTEKQFAEVLDRSVHTGLFAHYVTNIPVNTYCYKSGLESFESLIKSLGWYLFDNPKGKEHPDWRKYASTKQYQQHSMDWIQAESKTLYNPILLKKV